MTNLPRSLGPYRIIQVLGSGSAGLVYRGQHRDTAEIVALKRVRMSDERLLEGIRREVHTLARLRHPGIVRIVDEGVEDGLPWFAMELLDGPTLRQFTAAHHRVPVNEVLTLMRRLCAPLGFLHGEGIVHRDLKPDNVLLRGGERKLAEHGSARVLNQPEGSGWMDAQPVITDFGLVSRFTDVLSRETLDVSGAAVGTVDYMAPEQARGELVDARADLYAVGCIFYELLTGRAPFVGESPIEILRRHLDDEPRPPSQLADGVPFELDQLVLRLLAKQPRDRIGHADDLAAALARLGAGNGGELAAPRPRAYLYRPGFTGRDQALRDLDKRLEDLEADRRGGLVFVSGESGVGKTRLLLELARLAARRELRVLTGESLDVGGRPLEPLSKPLRALADHCRARGVDETERLLGRRGHVLARYEPALAELPGQLAHPEPAELPAEAALLRLYSDLVETLGAFAGIGVAGLPPLVLLLDDLQWADGLTLGFLEFLLKAGSVAAERAVPLLLVGAYRTEEVGEPLQRLLGAANAHGVVQVRLGRLEEAAVGAMVGEMLALDEAPALFVRYLSRQSEGNPFFVAEVLRTAVAEGLLYRDAESRWQVAEPAERKATEQDYESLPLPQSLRQLIGRRLEGLPQSALELAQAAAVLGREVQPRLVQRLLPVPVPEMLDALSELLRRQILQEVRAGEFGFLHDKIREIAYERIDVAERPKLHRAAAEGIEALLEKDAHLAALAHHWEQAGDRARAREFALAAARNARKLYAHAEVQRQHQAYLRLLERPTAESIEARNELGRDLMGQGRCREAILEHGIALEEARDISDHAGEVQSLCGLGRTHRSLGQVDTAGELYEQALALARESGDRSKTGIPLGHLALIRRDQGFLRESHHLVEQALAVARDTGDRRSEGENLGMLAILHCEQGNLEQAGEFLEQSMAIFRQIGTRYAVGISQANLALTRYYQGRIEEACQRLEQAQAIAVEVGGRWLEALIALDRAVFATEARPQEASGLYEQALTRIREVGDRGLERYTLVSKATFERRAGSMAHAKLLLEQAEPILQGAGAKTFLALCLAEQAHLLLSRGRLAKELVDRAHSLFGELWESERGTFGQAVVRLRHAIETFERNGHDRLYHGECVEDLSPGLRRWLVQTGKL